MDILVHTATITYVYADSAIFKAFREHSGSYYYADKGRWFNHDFDKYGLTFTCAAIGKEGFVMNTLSCKITFSKLLEKKSRLDVMAASDFMAVHEKFYEVVHDFIPEIADLHDWYANRVDYCVNVNVGTNKEVQEYVRLLQMSDIPYFMRKIRQKNGNYQFLPGSYYVVSKARKSERKTGSCTLNFYNKKEQLIYDRDVKGRLDITDDLLEQAEGMLRLEVQCHKPKIDYIRKKHGFDSASVSYFLSWRIAFDILQDAVLRVTRDADFWSKNKAVTMLEQSDISENMKKKLKKLLDEVAVSSIYEIKKKYLEKGVRKETFSNYLALLEKNNINVCTIPRDHHISHLDSVWKLLSRGFKEEQDL